MEFQTRWHVRSPDKPNAVPITRRQIRDYFGNSFFGWVDLGVLRFPGFVYYGGKGIAWTGVPVACASFPSNLDPEEHPHCGHPSLNVFQVPKAAMTDRWPELTIVLERIHEEWREWLALPDTGRLHRRAILFTVEDDLVRAYRSRD